MNGLETLVPATSVHPAAGLENSLGRSYESATDTGDSVLATAATSSLVRFAQPGSVCQAGFGSYRLQPLPVRLQAISDHPREFDAGSNRVPPTAITYGEAAGYSTS